MEFSIFTIDFSNAMIGQYTIGISLCHDFSSCSVGVGSDKSTISSSSGNKSATQRLLQLSTQVQVLRDDCKPFFLIFTS